MLYWIFIIILAYLFFSIASLGDKLVLNNSPNPKLYVTYVGLLSLLVILLIPFVGISLPDLKSLLYITLSSLIFIIGLYVLYLAVSKFEVSRVVTVVGATQPIFILFLSLLFWKDFNMDLNSFLAFLALVLGSIIISFENKFQLSGELLRKSLLTSFVMAIFFISIKLVFSSQSFFNAIIWIGIFNFLFVVALFFRSDIRRELFVKKTGFSKKTLSFVILAQLSGGVAGLLQNFAIYLAPVNSLAIINALRGIQYVFLFIITLFFSVFFPKIFKEEISGTIIIQKVLAIILIAIGLAILIK